MTPAQFEWHLERRARRVPEQIDVHGWFDHWHTHVDWRREVKRSKVRRQAELRVLFRLHDRLAELLATRREPWQIWVSVFPGDPGMDEVCVHTPHPNGGNPFPHVAVGTDWDCDVPDWLAAHASRPAFDIGLTRGGRRSWLTIQRADGSAASPRLRGASRRRRSQIR